MSTFKGFVPEFPEICIDFFRRAPGQDAPLAGFLSHVHSDHLQGLESVKGIFIYCSPATKEMLLRLEKYPHRMNFAKNTIESRQQTYKHLTKLLKPIPLSTPTTIELSTGNEIRVTLFDANHCTGAVMFLIQSKSNDNDGGKAILYTGDIRSEAWWVNSLVREPVLMPYLLGRGGGGGRRLDRMYLDTSFASNEEVDKIFPSKARGLGELLEKVGKYPEGTLFYIEAWTFGYENVWIALSSFLGSQIHLDRYRWGIYKSLRRTAEGAPQCEEAPPLVGFELGNHRMEGCLTNKPNVQLHSCERGTNCPVIDNNDNNVVRIVPIVTRLANGTEVHEMGIGGGKGDLNEKFELELDDAGILGALFQLCAARIKDQNELLKVYSLLNSVVRPEPGQMKTRLDLETGLDRMKLEDLVDFLARKARGCGGGEETNKHDTEKAIRKDGDTTIPLPKEITFPYSRHSSYSELCDLVAAFRPKDIYPCTVDENTWTPDLSMRALFGEHCSGDIFAHDAEMMEKYDARMMNLESQDTRNTETQRESQGSQDLLSQRSITSAKNDGVQLEQVPPISSKEAATEEFFTPLPIPSNTTQLPPSSPTPQLSPADPLPKSSPIPPNIQTKHPPPRSFSNPISPPKRQRISSDRSIRKWAYRAAAGLDDTVDSWDAFGGLSCVKRDEGGDVELGEEGRSGKR
ncbi:hypothetical protein EJ08DRAFT_679454 [Tothia fuscella]|uniref:Protein artemis n=1 Tax=Tothia fuscella TaxID=1048955 RepID=A0A9P4NQG3_9PEZI|nr:hypothetical protein EJ08DRAFT_679454 [Tothia fuscella]